MGHLTDFEVVLVAVCVCYFVVGFYKFIKLIGNGGTNHTATQK